MVGHDGDEFIPWDPNPKKITKQKHIQVICLVDWTPRVLHLSPIIMEVENGFLQ